MTQHENILFLNELPQNATFTRMGVLPEGFYFESNIGYQLIPLPPGSYQFIALHSQMTEEKARGVVEWYGKGDGSINGDGIGDIFTCYDETEFCYDTALESYYSLCRHLGLKGEQSVLKKL